VEVPTESREQAGEGDSEGNVEMTAREGGGHRQEKKRDSNISQVRQAGRATAAVPGSV
jgi:hypothetical protein